MIVVPATGPSVARPNTLVDAGRPPAVPARDDSPETARHKARAMVLLVALDRLRGGADHGGAAALITGRFTASGGLSVLASGGAISALITDDRGRVPPWVYYNDAARADRVTIDAARVDNVYSAGGNDLLTIRASGAVTAVNSGNDADIVSIAADVVSGVSLDVMEDPVTMASGVVRAGDDVAQIAGRLVSSVHGGGGNDRMVIAADEVSEIGGQEGDDHIALAARTATGISGGDGDDRLILDVGRGETEGDLFSTDSFAKGTAPTHAAFRTDIQGGAGDDVIEAAIGTQLGIEGGQGNDRITIASGRGALVWSAGDGDDRVTLGAGAEVVLRLEGMTGYEVTRDGNSLTLRLGSGQIRFDGLDHSGFIAVSLGWGRTDLVHAGATLDRRA